MNAREFNELKLKRKYDQAASAQFYDYCLMIIKRRLLYRNGLKDLGTTAHSIMVKFVKYLPDHYISAPVTYINKSVDNYLSTNKSKNSREEELTYEVSYEQRFDALEASEVYRNLEKYLSEEDAYLIYAHIIEGIPEKELANSLKMSYPLVRQRISRGLKKLKKFYEEDVTKYDP